MLALFCIIKVTRGVVAAAASANDTQADVRFVNKAVSTGRDEVVSSSAAVSRSASRAITRVANGIRASQRAVGEQLLEIARAKGMPVPVRNAAGRLVGYSDAAFIEHEIKSHLEAIALYEDEAVSSDAQLRAFAQRVLPQLHQHLALLRSLKMGK